MKEDGKGSFIIRLGTKEFDKDVQNASSKFDDLGKSAEDAGKKVDKSLIDTAPKQRELTKEVKQTTKSTDELGDASTVAFNGKFAAGLFVVGAGIVKVLGYVHELIFGSKELAMEAEGIEMAYKRLNNPNLLKNLRDATSGTVDDIELMKASVQASNFGIPVEKLGTLLKFAQQQAAATGQSVDYLVNSIVTGLGRESVMILDNLQIDVGELQNRVKSSGDFMGSSIDMITEKLKEQGDVALTERDKETQAINRLENAKLNLGKRFMWLNDISNNFYNRLASMIEALAGETRSATEVFDDHISKVASLEMNTVPLVKRYEELKLKTELTADEQVELNKIMNTISGTIPGVVAEFDNYGNILSLNTQKVYDYIDAERARLEFVNKEAIESLRKQRADLKKEYDMQESISQNGKLVISGGGQFGGGTTTIDNSDETLQKATKNVKAIGKQLQGLDAELERLTGESLTKQLDSQKESIKKRNEFNSMSKEALSDWITNEANALNTLVEINKKKDKELTKEARKEEARRSEFLALAKTVQGQRFGNASKVDDKDLDKNFLNRQNTIQLQKERIKQLEEKQAVDSIRSVQDLENQASQARINAMNEGFEKEDAQREHNNKLELQAIERQKEDYIRAFIQAEKDKFDAQEDLLSKQDENYTKRVFDSSSVKVDTSIFDAIQKSIKDKQANFPMQLQKQEDDDWREYLIQFGSYHDKRNAIIEKYNDEIDKALTQGKKDILFETMQRELSELDNSIQNSTTLIGQLFSDTARKSVGEIQTIIDKAELLMQYLEAVKDEQGNAIINGKDVSRGDILGLGVSEQTIKDLELSAKEIESLRNAIQKLKGELGSKSPFLLLKSQITDAVEKIQQGGKKNIAQGVTEIGTASSRFAPDIAQFGKELGNIVGNDDLGNKIAGIAEGIGGLGETAAGVGQIMSGDIVGGTMAAVSGISKVVSAVDGLFGADYSRYNKMKEEYEKLNSIWDELIDKKKEYIKTSFGPEAYKVGQEAEELTRKAIENYRILGRERLNAGSSAGSHSIGRRQWRDMSDEGWRQAQAALGSDWKKEYGDKSRMDWLFNLSAEQLSKLKEAGVFWAKLDDDVQGYLNSIIEGQERIDDINKSIQEQLTQVSFDSVRNSFVDTLLDMSSDAESFADDFTKYMQRAILNSKIADLMDNELKEWYDDFAEANKDGVITDSEYNKLQNKWNGIVDKGLDMREKLKEAMDWEVDEQREGAKGGFMNASQDSVNEGIGTLYAMRQIQGDIRNINIDLRENSTKLNEMVLDMRAVVNDNNQILQDSLYYQSQIAANTYRTAEILDAIETYGLKLKQ